MFAHLAAMTERIGFATGVLVLPQRQTALVASQATDVDLLSDGRLRLGVGVGWNHVEFAALGQNFRTRGARLEEQIELLRRLFTEPVFEFSGRFDRVDRACLVPKPLRSIPVWLGGFGEKAFDRAARLGDGFIFFSGGIDHNIDAWVRLRDRVRGCGRSVEDFGGDYLALREQRQWPACGRKSINGGRQSAPMPPWRRLASGSTPSMLTSTTWHRSRGCLRCRDVAATTNGTRDSPVSNQGARPERCTIEACVPVHR